jgi:hypothetical protein
LRSEMDVHRANRSRIGKIDRRVGGFKALSVADPSGKVVGGLPRRAAS